MSESQTPAADGTPHRPRISTRAFTIGAVVAALVIACVVSVWASVLPDGLTFVAATTGHRCR